MELKTIAELIAHAGGAGAGAACMLKAARDLLDVAIAAQTHTIDVPALPAPEQPRRKNRKARGGGRTGKRVGARHASPLRKKERAPRANSHAAPAVTANGVTVEGNVVSYKGRSVTVSPKHAEVAAALARVMPSLLSHVVLAQQIWPGVSKESADVCAAAATRELGLSLDAIGLKVTRVRGMGACLSEL
jgi:hypothetical protein